MIITKADLAKIILGFLRSDSRTASERAEALAVILSTHGIKWVDEVRDDQVEAIAQKVMEAWHPQ